MNWEEIKKKFPYAYTQMEVWSKENFAVMVDRDLYDFFDEREIYPSVWVLSKTTDGTKDEGYGGFRWGVNRGTNWHVSLPTRKEAETAAFTKSFEILEEKFNTNQT